MAAAGQRAFAYCCNHVGRRASRVPLTMNNGGSTTIDPLLIQNQRILIPPSLVEKSSSLHRAVLWSHVVQAKVLENLSL